MSTAATMSQPPTIPPRPSRSSDRPAQAESQPMVPPRPIKRFDRSISPNPHRFAPSPINESPFSKSPRTSRFPDSSLGGPIQDPIQRPGSVNMPSVGEEGNEYEAVRSSTTANQRPVSPEQTRMIAEDLKLHAPKPSFSAQSAKQRVATVTRTDSDKAASFGIGRPSSGELPPSYIKKKRSSIGQASEAGSIEVFDDEEHGIPEIGQQVPLNPHLGDVQAPSPAPNAHGQESARSHTPRHHGRKLSSRGYPDAPPGSYGLHGHGTPSNDKFERAWYEKHPESKKRESQISLHDRQNDFAMSSTDLNKIVRDTREAGVGTSTNYTGTPSEEVGYQASEEYAHRMHSRPGSAAPRSPELRRASTPRKDSPAPASASVAVDDDTDVIHVDADHNRSRSFLNSRENLAQEDEYNTPILAADEVAKNPHHYNKDAAVPADRRGSFLDDENSSRPNSRPSSLYHHGSQSQVELTSTPLEDVTEYEPLFPEEEEQKRKAAAKANEPRHKFPSKDIWEDAPDSVNATAMVSTPEFEEEDFSPSHHEVIRTETPAQAFARQQEELAEKESRQSPESYGLRQTHVPRPHPAQRMKSHEARPHANRFPSRDVWEDTPESLMHETTVDSPDPESAEPNESNDATDESSATSRPAVPARPQKKLSADKPTIPERPKPSSTPSDERLKPVISDKPKPQVPARPTKTLPSGVDSKEQDAAPRQKPAVPARPVGSKIQALQAGFMSDLNKRLQQGPQAPAKKEEPPAADMIEEKEKAPLADARKGRARGPQRRAPVAKSQSQAADIRSSGPTLSFSPLRTCWSIGDDGILEIENSKPQPKKEEPEIEFAPEAVEEESVPEPESNPVEPASTAFEAAEKGIDSLVPSEKLEFEAAATSTEQQVSPEVTKPQETDAAPVEEPAEQVKTLASNTAGEPILEAQIQQAEEVKPVAVQQLGGEAA
ncbi:hypothetical protein BN1708_011274 [Verticillium longisporum]|uniref:Altered inheritance of mitochondria protein 21 n=1 Tax=Verticillium longisporum TaxID=100787 RepID=A0A0G4KYM2_VERLO|nr:hypothetical protein BN1708_011274 [Verticillium longisporum]